MISDPRVQPKSWAYRVQRCYLNLQSGTRLTMVKVFGRSIKGQTLASGARNVV